MMTNKEIIQVVAAFEAGEKIESRMGQGTWMPCPRPNFDFYRCEFRVAPELFERWANLYDGGASFHASKQSAKDAASPVAVRVAIHLREVLDD